MNSARYEALFGDFADGTGGYRLSVDVPEILSIPEMSLTSA